MIEIYKSHLCYYEMVVAISHPQNLRDILTRAALDAYIERHIQIWINSNLTIETNETR